MTAPTRGSSTDTSTIEVLWGASTDTGGSAITSYHLEQESKVTAGVWISVQGESGSESLLTSYTKTGLSQGDSYTYRVSAVNQYGSGTASTTVTLVSSSEPEAPSAPVISLSNTYARITFVAPDNNGETIDAYRVKIR
jgi:Fibronectin type III domain